MNPLSLTCEYNKKIFASNLGISKFGNAGISHNGNLYIKPSGVDVCTLIESEVSVLEIKSAKQLSGLSPSTDTPTYIEILKSFPSIGAIIHTHSKFATAWAQTCKPIPCIGTSHADYWSVNIPVTEGLSHAQIVDCYEKQTGLQIVNKIKDMNVHPLLCPGILVSSHGPFVWGKNIQEAYEHAILLEYVAEVTYLSLNIKPNTELISSELRNKHFNRKNGKESYYGQSSTP